MRVTQFILSHFRGISEIEQVNPYAHCGPAAPSLVKEETTTQEFRAIQGLLTLQKNSGDMLVSPRTIYIRHFKNPNKHSIMHIRRLFSHAAAAEDDAMQDKIATAMGILPGCYLHMPPETEGSVSVFVLREHPDSLYLQSSFVKTCLLLNETNLMNGILVLREKLEDLPARATVFDQKGEDVSYDIDFYYFIPANHVLSWCLTVGTGWRQKKGIFALEFTVAPKSGARPYLLYYLVDNHSFDRIKASFLKEFIHKKIDVRPVNSLGVELINNNADQDNMPVSVTLSFTYAIKPRLSADEQNALAPTLDPHFVPYSHILEKELEKVARDPREPGSNTKND